MAINAKTVKELRDKTGAGMMDCKKALEESSGDIKSAIVILREKGIADAKGRMGRATKEGLIASYIHPGNKLGVLVDVRCETDFVAKNEIFVKFVKNLAMHIAATGPLAIDSESLNPKVVEQEREIYRNQAIKQGKPEKILDKIVEGRIKKFYSESCLLDQQYVRDQEKTIKDLLTDVIVKTGENIRINRFARFRLGDNS